MALTNIRRLNIFKKNRFLFLKHVDALHINCSHPFQGCLFSETLGFLSWHFEAVVGMWKVWVNEGRLFLKAKENDLAKIWCERNRKNPLGGAPFWLGVAALKKYWSQKKGWRKTETQYAWCASVILNWKGTKSNWPSKKNNHLDGFGLLQKVSNRTIIW